MMTRPGFRWFQRFTKSRAAAHHAARKAPEGGSPSCPHCRVNTLCRWAAASSSASALIDFLAHEQSRDDRPIVLYGLSAGGMLTYRVAAKAPEGAVRGIVGMTFLDQRIQQVRDETAHHKLTSRVGMPLVAEIRVRYQVGNSVMTEEPNQSRFISRPYRGPWESLTGVSPWSDEQIENLRHHEHELESKGSEFSYGRGTEPRWITARADREHRYATPAEGGAYHGKAPRLPEPIIGCGRHRPPLITLTRLLPPATAEDYRRAGVGRSSCGTVPVSPASRRFGTD